MSSSSVSGDFSTNIYTIDEDAHNLTMKSFQSKVSSTPACSSVKEEHLDVIMYHPQLMVKLDKIVSGKKRTVSKGACLALENGSNHPQQVILEGWSDKIAEQVNQLATMSHEKGHVGVFKYEWKDHLGDPYFLTHATKDSYCKILNDGQESFFVGDVSFFIMSYSCC